MVNFTSLLFGALAFSAIASAQAPPPPPPCVTTIVNFINNVLTPAAAKVGTDAALIATPGINSTAQTGIVIVDITRLTANVTTATGLIPRCCPLSEASGTAILNAVQNFEVTLVHSLAILVSKKPAISAIPVVGPGLVLTIRTDLGLLRTAIIAFFTALINCLPADEKATATAYENAILAAIAMF